MQYQVLLRVHKESISIQLEEHLILIYCIIRFKVPFCIIRENFVSKKKKIIIEIDKYMIIWQTQTNMCSI